MVIVQFSKLSLPPSSPPLTSSSILFEPNSLSLALIHSDSSLSLFPSLPFPSLSSLPPNPQILISSSSSSAFLHLLLHDGDDPRILFLAASPHKGGSQILLKFFLLDKRTNVFTRALVLCTQKGVSFDPRLGVLVDVNHGVSIKIVGSVNFFVIYSISSKKVWIFSVKLVGDGDVIKLMRCGVIECCFPVWSMCVSGGFLILGEDSGVRVFNLRQLLKGKVNKKVKGSNSIGNFDLNGKLEGRGFKLPNGVIGNDSFGGSNLGNACNGLLDRKIDNRHRVSVKQRFVRRRQDLDDEGAIFVALKSMTIEGLQPASVKVVSVQALSPKTFVILDSSGDLHILSLSILNGGSNILYCMRRLPYGMKVQKMAVLPDSSSRNQIVCVSDGLHSVHMVTVSDIDDAFNKDNEDDSPEKPIPISVIQAIFTGEKIQDLLPLASNGILILGQGNIYTYPIP